MSGRILGWRCGLAGTEIPRGAEPMGIGAGLEGGGALMQAPPLPSLFLEIRQRVPSLAPSALALALPQLPPFSQNPFS